ncbi:MAG TPA: ABC transporter substrate-binding protein [Syntrophorhabdaceae bacterium]|nr:ABC transporter substrate-binding protein [Syntrophorhabdaceae bacterium]
MRKDVTIVRFWRHALMVCLVSIAVFCPVWDGLAKSPQYGGVMRMSDQTDGISIGYPPKLLRVYGIKQASPAVETLFRIDKTGRAVPWLVKSFKENAVSKSVTLVLRTGVKFHDGTDFNAEAVKWNLEEHLAAKSQGTEKIKSIDVLDSETLRINLSEWDNTLTSSLALTLGMIISPTACKKNGEEWAMSHPVGTGPFQFVSWEKDVRTIYKKFPNYWQKGKPYLDGIEWIPIADSNTRTLSFKRGELDLILWVAAKDVTDLEKGGALVTRRRAGSGVTALVPDSANPVSPFAKLKVRQAAQYAIDEDAVVRSIFHGEAEVTNQWAYRGHWAFNPSIIGYPYNPAKARKLLAEAGYPKGFKTKLIYRTTPEADQLFAAVQGYLQAVGIDAELEPAQTGRWNQAVLQGGKWEGLAMGDLMPNPETAAALLQRYSGGGPFFTQMLAPEDYVQAIKRANTAQNFKEKQKWTREALKSMIDTHCLQIILYAQSFFAVSKPYLHNHGFYETPNGVGSTPEEAWIER